MAEKLTYSHRIAAGWRVEYKLTKKGGELAIIVGGGFLEFRLTKTRDLDALHEALHTAEKAAVALDGVGVETLGWGGEEVETEEDGADNPVDIGSEFVILRRMRDGDFLFYDALLPKCRFDTSGDDGRSRFHSMQDFKYLVANEFIRQTGPNVGYEYNMVRYTISDAGRAALAEQAG